MEFLKKRVRQYQEKKLQEALDKIKFHQTVKKNLEDSENQDNKVTKEIALHDKMIRVWQNNYEKIRNEMKKIDS